MGWGRAYFAAQAVLGTVWWVAVFTVPPVRALTLGGVDPVLMALLDIPLFVGASAVAACGVRWAASTATLWTLLVTVGLASYATVTREAGAGVVLMSGAAAASVVAFFLVRDGRVPTHLLLRGPFRSREADAAAPARRHVVTTGVQLILFWVAALGVAPLAIAWLERRWQLAIWLGTPLVLFGVTLFVAASALGLWSAAVMSTKGRGTPLPSGTATRLVVAGPYRLIRNPMAVAGITQGIAVGLMLSSWLVIAYAVCGSLVWNYAIRPHEERDLEERFGAAFVDYRRRVRCWLPRWRSPVPASAHPFAE
jgi:protein-S-isoprenylcysteine O-methyltransferase Ste14